MKTESSNLQHKILPKMLPGYVRAEMVKCGKASCKCSRGKMHGPYLYHFKRVNGVMVKRYVKANDASATRAACAARRREVGQQREARKNNRRQLGQMLQQLRKSEKLILQFLEGRYGKAE